MSELETLGREVGLRVQTKIYDDYLPERGVLRPIELVFPFFKRRVTVIYAQSSELK